jgi:hypothetical protein
VSPQDLRDSQRNQDGITAIADPVLNHSLSGMKLPHDRLSVPLAYRGRRRNALAVLQVSAVI